MKDSTKNVLNKILTAVVILLAVLCIVLAVKVIRGQDTGIFGYQVYHILTGSMEPTIPTGSIVIAKKTDPDRLKEGDVISFISRDEAIYGNINTHRIIGIDDSGDERRFITKGDANGSVDSVEIPASDVKGKVIFHANFKGFSMFLDFMRTGYGFVTVICFPFIFILWQISMKLKREIKEYAEENAKAELEYEYYKAKAAEREAAEKEAAEKQTAEKGSEEKETEVKEVTAKEEKQDDTERKES